MHGSDTSVLVPQLRTSLKLTTPSRSRCGVVWRAQPFRPQFAARAVSPTTTTSTSGLAHTR